MPDGGVPRRAGTARKTQIRGGWVSPLLRRILLVNAMPLALLVAALLYLDQYQNGLLEAEVGTLREQARIYAGALGESAVSDQNPANPQLVPDIARPLLRRLTEPTPNAEAKLYGPDGSLVADSRARPGQGDTPPPQPTPQPTGPSRGNLAELVAAFYNRLLDWLPQRNTTSVSVQHGAGLDWQPDVKQELRISGSGQSGETPPYIRRTESDQLLVTVAEPVQHNHHTVGIVLLTRDAREVDKSLFDIRMSIIGLFLLALALTVMLSWYLSLTIARPILRLAGAVHSLREGAGRGGDIPANLLRRRDEIGTLAHALANSARALWTRMDAIERFAADVAHEIKNPLSSIRSAIETLRRVDNEAQRQKLLAIIADDVQRLDRLISDISDASRLDAELSRESVAPLDVAPILKTLAEIHDATRQQDDPVLHLVAPAGGLVVRAVEGRLVQVLRNLLANAQSFSPPGGTIYMRAGASGSSVEISVEDEGPGIPQARLEHVFDRFYSERPAGEQFGKHSGLGLSISRQIVEALKGRISAENRLDAQGEVRGARFVVRLPLAEPPGKPTPKPAPRPANKPASRTAP